MSHIADRPILLYKRLVSLAAVAPAAHFRRNKVCSGDEEEEEVKLISWT